MTAPAVAPLVSVGETVRVFNAPPGLVVQRSSAPSPEAPRRRTSLLDVRFNFAAPVEEPVVAPVIASVIAPVVEPVTVLEAAAADRDHAEFLSVDAFVDPTDAPRAPHAPRPSGGGFVTETMAELYLRQGLVERALEIFRLLAARNPDDARLRARVAELEGPEPEPAADAMLSGVSFEGFALPTPPMARATEEGRTARAVFAALSRRGVGPASPSPSPMIVPMAGGPAPRTSAADLAAAITALSTAPLPLGGAHDDAFDDWLRGSA